MYVRLVIRHDQYFPRTSFTPIKGYVNTSMKLQTTSLPGYACPTRMKDLPDVLKFCEGNIQLFLPSVMQFSEKSYQFLED